jgi:hypothetical protein
LLYGLTVSLALVLHHNYVLHERLIGAGSVVAGLLCQRLLDIVNRDLGGFEVS